MLIRNSSSYLNLIRHPLNSFEFYRGNKSPLHRSLILDSANYLLGKYYNRQAWNEALDEIDSNDLIPSNLPSERKAEVGNNLNTSFGKWIYCSIRVLKPDSLIETGVAHGYSSWIILNALHRNGKGKLYSIDLPNHDTNREYNFTSGPTQTGWLVPDSLKPRWSLHLGDARSLLPALLKEIGMISCFFHDSDHSYEHMKWEFETVWDHLTEGALFLSDDVHKNKAFSDLVSLKSQRALQFNKGGSLIKHSSKS